MSRPVTLIVLAWNSWPLTRRCLDTLLATDLGNARVMVVDNGSEDETPEGLKDYSGIEVVTLPENLGFVRGNNAGIVAAEPGSDIVLLNNDLEFRQRDWLSRLQACAHAASDIGVVGCRMVLPDRRLLHAGTYLLADTLWGQQIGALEIDIGQYTRTREVQGIAFACAYLKREALDAVGVLSTEFHSYFEDTDYCLRVQAAGLKVLLCGGVTLIHQVHGSTATRPAFRRRLFSRSRRAFGRLWQERLQAGYRHEVLWQSIFNVPSGYARASRYFLHALERQGVRAVYRYVYGPGTPMPAEEPPDVGDYLLDVVRSRAAPRAPATSVVFGQGDVFRRSRGRRRIGFTMLEVDGFPAEWVRQANRLDEVWVPSEFNRVGFVESGLKRPIHVIPLGIDPDHFHPGLTGHPNPHGEFVFLANFEWGERKAPELLLRAFSDEFSADEPVRLLCKVINRDSRVHLRQEIGRLQLRPGGGRISYLFNLNFPHYQLGSLYRSVDAYVSAGRGEGWDLPLMEAMACGLPAIATDWGGHRAFFHQGVGYPLQVRRLIPAVARCPYYQGFRWADPDPEHLRHLLRHVVEHRAEARARGAAAAREVAQRWTWEHAAQRIVEQLAAG